MMVPSVCLCLPIRAHSKSNDYLENDGHCHLLIGILRQAGLKSQDFTLINFSSLYKHTAFSFIMKATSTFCPHCEIETHLSLS